jgi:hypothetical protein
MPAPTNKYKHPQLFKGTRLTLEYGPEVPGIDKVPSELVAVPVSRLWADVHGIERLGNSKLVLGDEAPKSVTILVFESGYYYVTDPLSEVLEAWECYLNEASLRHKTLLSN